MTGTTYYLDPSGNDSNNGSNSSPWKTLAYACSKATISGDIIHVNAGTFTETIQSSLAVGVSIEGVGVNSIILSHVGGSSYTISLYSSTQGTDGNQHISGIKMDGNNLTAYAAIQVAARKNVKIFNCTFINFLTCGILFDGQGGGGQPSTYPTGNEFHDNTVDNCSIYTPNNDPYGEGWGLLKVSGQQDMLIYNNILTQTGRTTGSNGYCIKAIQGRNKGIKIYGNTITKNQSDSNTWDFAIEFWNTLGGIEIYNNTITAGIDFSGSLGTTTGTYSYAAWIHDNTIGPATLTDTYMFTKGIYFELISENVIVERNHIRNVGAGVYFPLYQQNNNINNITIRYNIFDNIGVTSGNYSGWGIFCNVAAGYQNTINGFNVYNNVFMGHTGGITPEAAVYIPASGGSMTNIVIRNNIIENFTGEPVYLASSTGFSIENNIFYNNGHSNVPVYSGSGTVQNNLTSNPLFVSTSDFHLQAGSPATGKGLAISGITTDFSGNTLKSPPSIGAYESASGTQAPVSIAPVYQSSAVQNTTPSLLEMTYDLNLNNLIVPAISSFNVLVNSVVRTVSTIRISGNKVQLTLSSTIKFGDKVTVSYSKPITNPLQTATGGAAISISTQLTINNLINQTKDSVPVTITLSISPNHVHRIMNVVISYSSTPTTVLSPEVIKVSDLLGTLLIEKLLVTGTTNARIPLNLNSGIYNVNISGGGVVLATQRMMVY